jgi:hypothetical protein
MKKIYFFVTIILLVLSGGALHGQNVITKNDTVRLFQETLLLRADEFREQFSGNSATMMSSGLILKGKTKIPCF